MEAAFYTRHKTGFGNRARSVKAILEDQPIEFEGTDIEPERADVPRLAGTLGREQVGCQCDRAEPRERLV
jgi:hypothetical protein